MNGGLTLETLGNSRIIFLEYRELVLQMSKMFDFDGLHGFLYGLWPRHEKPSEQRSPFVD